MTATAPRRSRAAQPAAEPRAAGAVVVVKRLFAAEAPEYFLLLGTTMFLLAFGLVMVLSSSSIEAYVSQASDFFSVAARQGLYALIGVPLMLIAARMPISFWKRSAPVLVVATVALQLLVLTPLGYDIGNNRNWIRIGTFTAQPSELIKLALAIWFGWVLTERAGRLTGWRQLVVPALPAVAGIGLVLIGHDLGTAMIMFGVVLGCLFYGGVKLRVLGAILAVAAVASIALINTGSSRSDRIGAWLSGCTDGSLTQSFCYQTVGGWQALAHGGVLGVGLGNSTAKWNWLPEASNDFIFAVIGEELGLFGAILVLVLFLVLAVCFVRVIRMVADPFAKIVTGGVLAWIVGQALVNIAVVLGLLPVFGVPLPLISAGGSALIATLAGIGVVLSFARHRPEPVVPPAAPRGARLPR